MGTPFPQTRRDPSRASRISAVTDPSAGHRNLRGARGLARAAGRGWLYLARLDREWRQQRDTAPFPLLRWAAGLGILVSTAGGGSHGVGGWWRAHGVQVIIAAAIAAGPEITRIEFGGMRMELLRETREEVRALGAQVSQLQVQQAAATSTASAGVNQFYGISAVAGVNAAAKQGEETPSVPAQDVDWQRLLRLVQDTSSSTASEAGSTVRE
jgi:hypothetical protein